MVLFACTPAAAEPTATGTDPISPTVGAAPSATLAEPTQEATPIIMQSKVVFISAAGADSELTSRISTTLAELAES